MTLLAASFSVPVVAGDPMWADAVRGKALEHAPAAPTSAPCRLCVTFWLPREKRGEQFSADPCLHLHARRPVGSALVRDIEHALCGIMWHHNGQVCEATWRKLFVPMGEAPGVAITVEVLTP